MPVGIDYFTIERLTREGTRRTRTQIPVLVAPALPIGRSDHHLPFGATLSIGTRVYYKVL